MRYLLLILSLTILSLQAEIVIAPNGSISIQNDYQPSVIPNYSSSTDSYSNQRSTDLGMNNDANHYAPPAYQDSRAYSYEYDYTYTGD